MENTHSDGSAPAQAGSTTTLIGQQDQKDQNHQKASAESIRRARLTLAVENWPGTGATLYGPALGMFLALVRAGDPALASTLHDGSARKPFSLSPLRIKPTSAGIAHAEIDVSLWDDRLQEAIKRGLSTQLDETLDVIGHRASLLDCLWDTQTSFSALLDTTPPHAGQTVLWTRFTTPTVFSWGRGVDGHHRYGLLPTPELVVGSWLRAWQTANGPDTIFSNDADWLRDRIRIHTIHSLQTVVAHTGKTPISGFVGEVAYEWCGATPGGPRTLRALGSFARFCGTGAKTAYGLGQTTTWIH